MSKEKQIEEMSKDLYDEIEFDLIEHEYSDESFWTEVCFDYHKTAENIINKGYRKQRVGEWIFHNDGSGTCNQCQTTQKNVWDMDNYQYYCGHCGAKMK